MATQLTGRQTLVQLVQGRTILTFCDPIINIEVISIRPLIKSMFHQI